MKKGRQCRVRLCASCEWIYRVNQEQADDGEFGNCPQCGFVSYAARFVYGNDAYRLEKTQEPWKRKQRRKHESHMQTKVDENNRQFDRRKAARGLNPLRATSKVDLPKLFKPQKYRTK